MKLQIFSDLDGDVAPTKLIAIGEDVDAVVVAGDTCQRARGVMTPIFEIRHVTHRIPPIHERAQPPPGTPTMSAVGDHHPLQRRITSTDMLTTAFPFLLPHHIEHDLPAKLRTLADDLENIRTGTGPAASDIATAPLLVDWRGVLTVTGLRLAGFAAGHPQLGNRPVLTSQIWAADTDGRWVRTLSRFYRLGVPAGAHLLASQDESADHDAASRDRHD